MPLTEQDFPIGYELPPIVQMFVQERMTKFASQTAIRVNRRRTPVDVHTDEAFAKSLGLPGTIVQTLQYYAFASQMLCSALGEGWVRGGKMEMKFIRVMFVGDTVTCRAIVKDKAAEGNAIRITFDIWCENRKAEKVAVGTASGLLRSTGPTQEYRYADTGDLNGPAAI